MKTLRIQGEFWIAIEYRPEDRRFDVCLETHDTDPPATICVTISRKGLAALVENGRIILEETAQFERAIEERGETPQAPALRLIHGGIARDDGEGQAGP